MIYDKIFFIKGRLLLILHKVTKPLINLHFQLVSIKIFL